MPSSSHLGKQACCLFIGVQSSNACKTHGDAALSMKLLHMSLVVKINFQFCVGKLYRFAHESAVNDPYSRFS